MVLIPTHNKGDVRVYSEYRAVAVNASYQQNDDTDPEQSVQNVYLLRQIPPEQTGFMRRKCIKDL